MLSIFITFKYYVSNPHSKLAAMLEVKFILRVQWGKHIFLPCYLLETFFGRLESILRI